MSRTIRIATRPSQMALHQANQVATVIENIGLPSELIIVTTTGDQWEGDLTKVGGKGAFVKEIDSVLLRNKADLAVHCLKDIPGDISAPKELSFAGYLPRGEIRDAVVSRAGVTLAELPAGSVIGTSSVRRAAQLTQRFPNLEIVRSRGNVDTRLAKLDEGHFDALILAVSGLHRIGQASRITEILSLEAMCPPLGAGIIALQCRVDDSEVLALCKDLNDTVTNQQADAERAMLRVLQGHCNSPIAGYAMPDDNGGLLLYGKVFSRDGSQWVDARSRGSADDPSSLGAFVGTELLRKGAREIIDAIEH